MNGRIHAVKIWRESPPISHLMYVDDLVIFYHADEMEAGAIVECLGGPLLLGPNSLLILINWWSILVKRGG